MADGKLKVISFVCFLAYLGSIFVEATLDDAPKGARAKGFVPVFGQSVAVQSVRHLPLSDPPKSS
jgi:hypothetical protein